MCEYPPRADTAEKSDAFALEETGSSWHWGSKQPVVTSPRSPVLRYRWGAAPRQVHMCCSSLQLQGLLGSVGVLGNVGAVSWGSGKGGRNDCSMLIFISGLMTRLTKQDTPSWSPAN